MNFLLILSAMLSAVTGAFSGARAPDARPQHMAMASAEAASPDRMVRVARLEIPVSHDVPRVAKVFAVPAFDLKASIPVYADRLIE
jgi:hypothetical protein